MGLYGLYSSETGSTATSTVALYFKVLETQSLNTRLSFPSVNIAFADVNTFPTILPCLTINIFSINKQCEMYNNITYPSIGTNKTKLFN